MPPKAISFLLKPKNLRITIFLLALSTLLYALYHLYLFNYYDNELTPSVSPFNVNVNNLLVDVDEEYFRKENTSRLYNSFSTEKAPENHGRLVPSYNVSGISGKCQTIVPAASAIDANVVFPSLGFDVSNYCRIFFI